MTSHSRQPVRQFASDTYAGICPEAVDALREANAGHVAAYGDDPWTALATEQMQKLFETDCAVFFVATGTAANALALSALCQPFHSVFCHADAHVQTDECGAPEYAGRGIKLIPLPGRDSKIEPGSIRAAAAHRRDVHSHKPGALTLSQATEAGTVYTADELAALCATARDLGLRVHLDGARFANAVASLGVPPRVLSWQAGVDVLSFGGTKNGLAAGDALVFFNRDLARDFEYRRKQAGHLLAKMRFVAAPWVALLRSGAWLANAAQANAMAQHLATELRAVLPVQLAYPVQANAVFMKMPETWIAGLHARGWHFYTIAEAQRLMCSWDTEPADIAAFIAAVREVAADCG